MLRAQLRPLALACTVLWPIASAQDGRASSFVTFEDAASIYEESLQDVTLPIATYDQNGENGADAVTVPLENQPSPMQCMTAWSYLAGRAIEAPERWQSVHPDFTEASASAHWQHWLKQDLAAGAGTISDDFHQRRLAAERGFSLALAELEEIFVFSTLGACYIPPADREIGDPTLLLRNFMIEHQGLPESFAVPALQRQLRAFPITASVESQPGESCDADIEQLERAAKSQSNLQCFDRGGILASQTKVAYEQAEDLCRATATVQCENIP
ncbi:MAG: hypothetical protein ACX94B_05430 [Henriciella sp.]|nr:hypothetical protein [Hyphomonadaceae bacterium]